MAAGRIRTGAFFLRGAGLVDVCLNRDMHGKACSIHEGAERQFLVVSFQIMVNS